MKLCVSKTQTKDSVVFISIDSVRWTTREKDSTRVTPQIVQSFDLENLCDSLGKLRNFNIKTKVGGSSVTINSSGNKLNITTTCDSIIQRYRLLTDSLIRSSTAQNNTTHEAIVYVEPAVPPWWSTMPKWLWWYIIITAAIIILKITLLFSPNIFKSILPFIKRILP